MAFNPLIDPLPTEFGGVVVKTDFRQVLRFFRCLSDKSLTEKARAHLIIRLFFDSMPSCPDRMWEFIQEFVAAGDDKESSSGQKLFDFEVDSGRVYAAFLQTYGIDLSTAKIHWWLFMELFRAIPDNTMMMKVIDIRGKEIPNGKNADLKYARALRKAKAAYAIEQDNSEAMKSFFKGAR